MGQHNLELIMKPRHITVVGASEKEGSIGSALLKNLLAGEFNGKIFPVNPKHSITHGLHCYASVSALSKGIDLAIIATPIHYVPQIIKECAEREIGGVIIVSSGGKEIGSQGLEIEREIIEIARPAGMRIIGPNCLGIIRPGGNLNTTFIAAMPLPGNLAFVSQSGAICSAILDLALQEGIGFSHFVSVGSMIDVDFGDLIDYLGNHHQVKSILLYIENLTNLRKFMSAARSVSRVKPIIVLKAGRGTAGAKAAASHTGAMVGDDAVYDAAFKRAGIVRVDTIEELFDCAELMAKQPRPHGQRLAIITNGGGAGVMAADCLSQLGYEPASLKPETVRELDKILPPYWCRNNPIDILGDASPQRFRQVFDICFKASSFDGILVIFVPQAIAHPLEVAKDLIKAKEAHHFPVFACFMGGHSISDSLEFLNESGIPTFTTPERAIRAFLRLVAFAENQDLLFEVPPRVNRHVPMDRKRGREIIQAQQPFGFMPQSAVFALLEAYGLPCIHMEQAPNEEEASIRSRRIGYPVALKLCSPDISHKTDAAGVRLDLRSDLEVRQAFRQNIESARLHDPDARLEGVTVQAYVPCSDYEIMLGAKRDPDFGPVILFGSGGIFAEIIQDKALALPPLNRLLARRLLQDTRAYTMLQGYRNHPPADFARLEELIMGLSHLLVDCAEIAELDINPVLMRKGLPIVVDARVLLSPVDRDSPSHLVISPYPGDDEYEMVTCKGRRLFVRPIKPEDAPLFLDLFNVLSPTTIYFRFFGALKELRPEMLNRFTQIDYDREIAMVAIDKETGEERMLGVARIIGSPDCEEGEFAVLVGDAWQGQGIGAGLLQKCLMIAAKRGFIHIHGVVLKENTTMLALGRKLGFTVNRDEDSGEYQLHINLSTPGLIERISTFGFAQKMAQIQPERT